MLRYQVEKRKEMEDLHANESYSGSENPISLVIRYQGEFYCDFAEIEK